MCEDDCCWKPNNTIALFYHVTCYTARGREKEIERAREFLFDDVLDALAAQIKWVALSPSPLYNRVTTHIECGVWFVKSDREREGD